MANDWRTAYLKQAQSDFHISKQLLSEASAGHVALCHIYHYLQMTLEKLSKGYRIVADGEDLPHTHRGASHFIQLLRPKNKVNEPLHTFLSAKIRTTQIRSYLSSLLPTVNALEKLAPALAKSGVNVEYPWSLPSGVIIAPVDYDFKDADLTEARILKVVVFLSTIFDYLNLKELNTNYD